MQKKKEVSPNPNWSPPRPQTIDYPNQVWSADITYIRLEEGFAYLTAIMDWFSRYVLSWRLSNNLEADFCIEALEEALNQADTEIFNQRRLHQSLNYRTPAEIYFSH